MRDDEALRHLAERQHNLVGRKQALECGIDSTGWRRLGSGPHWDPVTNRVLRLSGAAPSRGEVLMAAILDTGTPAWGSHTSGAWWWRVGGFTPAPIQIVRVGESRHRTSLAITHRVRELDARWVTVLDGIPVVRPEVVILQLCGTEHPQRAARALDNAWNLRLLSGRSLLALLDDYGKRGRDGTAVLRELVEARGVDYTPPASNLEARVRDLLGRVGLDLRRQVDSGGDDWSGRVDFRDDVVPLILEVQSERYHSALLDVEADERRRDQLRADGFEVVEVTDVEVWGDGDVVVERVQRARRKLGRRAG